MSEIIRQIKWKQKFDEFCTQCATTNGQHSTLKMDEKLKYSLLRDPNDDISIWTRFDNLHFYRLDFLSGVLWFVERLHRCLDGAHNIVKCIEQIWPSSTHTHTIFSLLNDDDSMRKIHLIIFAYKRSYFYWITIKLNFVVVVVFVIL